MNTSKPRDHPKWNTVQLRGKPHKKCPTNTLKPTGFGVRGRVVVRQRFLVSAKAQIR